MTTPPSRRSPAHLPLHRGGFPAADVVWTSSNPAVATVDSSGNVTGIELGKATITATLNGSVIETFTVYSTLSNGLYVLEPYSTLHTLAATSISMEDGISMELIPYELETLQSTIGDIWYIKNVESTYYSIHPAFSRGMAIALPNSGIASLYRTTDLHSHKWHWQIESTGNGYLLRNRYYTNVTIAAAGEEDYSSVDAANIDSSDTSQRWNYYSAFQVPGMLLFDLRSGDLLAANFQSSSLNYSSGTVSASIQRNSAHTLDEISLSVQFIESSESQAFTMTFSPSYATFNLSTYEITGTQFGTTTATISRSINGGLRQLSFELTITPDRQISVYHYYDPPFSTAQLINIGNAIDFVNTAFTYSGYNAAYTAVYDRLYVSAGPYRNYTAFDSHYTECEYSDKCYDDVYKCGLDCTEHHRNFRRISQVLNSMNRENTLQVLWTDKPEKYFCGNASSVDPKHTSSTYIAVVCRDEVNGNYIPRQVVHFMRDPSTTSSESEAAMAITLAHEVAHTLGLEEAYLIYGHDKDGWECVMERYESPNELNDFYFNISSGTTPAFCPDCIDELTAALD